MAEWDAEIVVGERQARSLIASQFPELAAAAIELIGVGWDNTVFAVDGRWAFRFPRRAVALAGVEREIAVLPHLAPLLPVAIPEPRYVGRPGPGFPWPFFGAPLLDGDEATLAFGDAARARLAPALGDVLRRLHAVPPHPVLPHDPMGRVDMARRIPFAEQRLAELERAGLLAPFGDLRAVLDTARDLPPSQRLATVHGDLHVRHILVDAAAEEPLRGIIDWGDVCAGDPAMDVAIGWMLFREPERMRFLDAYGPMEPDQVARARVVAVFLSATLALYGAAEGMPGLRDESLAGLGRIIGR